VQRAFGRHSSTERRASHILQFGEINDLLKPSDPDIHVVEAKDAERKRKMCRRSEECRLFQKNTAYFRRSRRVCEAQRVFAKSAARFRSMPLISEERVALPENAAYF
jgi:hypothetical protein